MKYESIDGPRGHLRFRDGARVISDGNELNE